MPVLLYGNPKYPLQALPQGGQVSPNNHALHRKHRAETRVKLIVRRDLALQQLRKETVKHPFGTIKWCDGAHYFLCRGKEKVGAEMAQRFTGYDIRRAIAMTTPPGGGVPGILMHLRAKIKEKRIG